MVVFRARDLNREEVLDATPQLPEAKLPLHRGVSERMVRDKLLLAGNGGSAADARNISPERCCAGSITIAIPSQRWR
jgi:hypothetical protein